MEHLTEQQLNDYLDGLLSNAEQTRLDAHLAVCAECRTELTAMRRVLVDLHALPAGVKPERDLLPGIHAAIGAQKVARLDDWRTRSLWSLRVPLAAAAILLVVASVVVTR